MSTLIAETRTVMRTLKDDTLAKQPTFLMEMRIVVDSTDHRHHVESIDYIGTMAPLSSLDISKLDTGEIIGDNGCFGHVILLDDEAHRKQLERFIIDKVESIVNSEVAIDSYLISDIAKAISSGFKMFCDAHSFSDKEELESFATIFDRALNLEEPTSGTWNTYNKRRSAISATTIVVKNPDGSVEYGPTSWSVGPHSFNTVLTIDRDDTESNLERISELLR